MSRIKGHLETNATTSSPFLGVGGSDSDEVEVDFLDMMEEQLDELEKDARRDILNSDTAQFLFGLRMGNP